MKTHRYNDQEGSENRNEQALIVDIDPISPIESGDQIPSSITAHANTLDLPIPFIPDSSQYENDKRKLSSYAEELGIPIITSIRDLGIQKALRRATNWIISQREYKLEWIAFAAGIYAIAYVFSGLTESFQHLPFKP